MKKVIILIITMTMVMLLADNSAQAGVSVVLNGSFENNGSIPDITAKAPQRWCDVNLPAGKFGGWVGTVWSTHADCSLTLYSKANSTFDVNDTATVSQQVYLKDVNQIIFDIELNTDWPDDVDWDPDKFSAVVMIDGNSVWDSNDLELSGNGQYAGEVNGIDINDANLHTLSLGIRANTTASTPYYISYLVRWDFVKFDTHCGGFGYLPEDISRDCYVNEFDLEMLAGQWLAEKPAEKYDLFEDDRDTVNFKDYAILADSWLDYRDWRNWQDPNFVELEMPLADLNNDGVVNLRDFAILAGDWMTDGPCLRGNIDLSEDGIVDYNDLSIMTDEWLLKSWLYGLQ